MLFSSFFKNSIYFPFLTFFNWVLFSRDAYIGVRNKLESSGDIIDTHAHVLSFTWVMQGPFGLERTQML